MKLYPFLHWDFRRISPLFPNEIFVKLEKPKFKSFWASANLISEDGECMITAISDKLSLVALADRLNNAREVEPVLRPCASVIISN